MEYFSDRLNGARERKAEIITPQAWGGFVAIIKTAVSNGSFGASFPENCLDGHGPIGTDESNFKMALQAELPDIKWPLDSSEINYNAYPYKNEIFFPDTLTILDLIEFCHHHIAKPKQGSFHSFFGHHHLSFDVEAGRLEFRSAVNRIFTRNGLVYEIKSSGQIVRIVSDALQSEFEKVVKSNTDDTINFLLAEAKNRFLNPKPHERQIAIEKLWDVWERIKSLENPTNKKQSVEILLNKVSTEEKFRILLEKEARELTEIGNSFHIRHSEITQQQISQSEHIDYLFHRLYSFITLLLTRIA